MKRCTRCNQLKPLSEFHKRSVAKDRLQSWCANCNNEVSGQSHNTRREKERQEREAWVNDMDFC